MFGITGLPWPPLNPKLHFGRTAEVSVRIPCQPAIRFTTSMRILREHTLYAEHMGLRMEPYFPEFTKLAEHIAKNGYYPTTYLRKYPRIPAAIKLSTFPLRALVTPTDGKPHIIFEVSNLSPNGILISTENQSALSLEPDHRIDITFDQRGWFPMPIQVQGVICRVLDDINPVNRNLIRYFGVKFTKVSDVNRTAFINLLKDILEQIKNASA